MKHSTLILNHLLPRDAVELGRLVTNIHDPLQNYCQSSQLPLPDGSISIQRLEDFSAILQSSKSLGLSAFLTRMLSGNWALSRGVTTDVSAVAYETRQLANCEDVLRAACKLAPVRHWLEREARRKKSVYMISGIKILVDARVRQSLVRTTERGAGAQVPGALASIAAGVPLPLDDSLDVGIEGSLHRNSQEEGKYVASGEHVFAAQYRKVVIRKFESSDVDPNFFLGDNRWKVYLATRGSADARGAGGMEVEVGEHVSEHDIRKPCELLEGDDEDILFCP